MQGARGSAAAFQGLSAHAAIGGAAAAGFGMAAGGGCVAPTSECPRRKWKAPGASRARAGCLQHAQDGCQNGLVPFSWFSLVHVSSTRSEVSLLISLSEKKKKKKKNKTGLLGSRFFKKRIIRLNMLDCLFLSSKPGMTCSVLS